MDAAALRKTAAPSGWSSTATLAAGIHQNMRILYCIEAFWPHIGGAEVLASRFLPAMQDRGHDFLVVTSHIGSHQPDESMYHGIPVHRFSFHRVLADRDMGRLVAVRERLASIRRDFRPHLVHMNSLSADAFFHLRTMSAFPAPLVVTVHGLPLVSLSGGNNLVTSTMQAANWVACVSKAVRGEVCRLVPGLASRSSVIYNGLQMPSLLPATLCFDKPRLLCLGRFFPHKGFDLALAAFAGVLQRFPDAALVLAGDGPARFDLEQAASELGVEGAVEFVGAVPPEQVPEILNTATLVVMPSRREPFGLVALQAAQMARPVVAARVGGLPEVVVHDVTGLLVEPEHSAALTEAICFLLEHPGRAVAMGRAARRRARQNFAWTSLVDAYDAVYQRIA